MGRYRVLLDWTDDEGEHAIGDSVERVTRTPAEQVELERLIRYGVIEPLTESPVESEEDTQDEPESAPARRRSTKK